MFQTGFVIQKVKITVPRTYVISDFNGDEIVRTFYEKELQKTNQKEFRVEKVIKRKGNKLYVKWKGHNNSFNSWLDWQKIHNINELIHLKTEIFRRKCERWIKFV